MRKPRARFARGIRKVVGQCYNWFTFASATAASNAWAVNPFSVTAPVVSTWWAADNIAGRPWLSRALTTLMNTRATWLAMYKQAVTQAQADANTHVFVEGGLRQRVVVENPENYPQHLWLFKFILKCDAMPAVTQFSENKAWFDQTSRSSGADTGTISGAAGLAATYYPLCALDGKTAYDPVLREAMELRRADDTNMPRWSWQFPQLKKYVKMKTIFRGWIKPNSRKTIKWVDPVPTHGELRYKFVNDSELPTGVKHMSYYLMVETRTPRANLTLSADGSVPAAGMQTHDSYICENNAVPTVNKERPTYYRTLQDAGTYGKAYTRFGYLPSNLAFDFTSSFACRTAGDSLPNYTWCKESLFTKDAMIATVAGSTATFATVAAGGGARLSTRPVETIQAVKSSGGLGWYA